MGLTKSSPPEVVTRITVMFTLGDPNSSDLALLQLFPQQLLCCYLIQHMHKEHLQRELSHFLILDHHPLNTELSSAGLRVSLVALTSLRNLKLHGRKLNSILMNEIGMMVSPLCHCMLMKGQHCEI